VAFVRGFGLKKGALAATVAHDAHNVIAAGIGDEDIVHVVSAIRDAGGGMAVGRAGGRWIFCRCPWRGSCPISPWNMWCTA